MEFSSYLVEVVENMTEVFSSDIQTTTIAIAITSSLCCSLLWFVVAIATNTHQHQQQHSKLKKKWVSTGVKPPQISMSESSFQLNHRIYHEKACRTFMLFDEKPASCWSDRQVQKECTVPCLRCGSQTAEKSCRLMLCKPCCTVNPSPSSCYQTTGPMVPDVILTPSTSRINYSHCQLTQCPDRVGFLGTHLTALSLSHNNISDLPSEIACLTGLQQLHLQHNLLTALPENITSLSRVTDLDLSHNKLMKLPESLSQLTQLESLQLSHNEITWLPESIGGLTCLQVLNVSRNQLEVLPKRMSQLQKLKILHLRHNPLTELTIDMSEMYILSELDVSHCRLRVLHQSLSTCYYLERFSASHNRLVHLPCQLGHLHQLRELYIDNNRLASLPASIAGLNLRVLTAHDNNFASQRVESEDVIEQEVNGDNLEGSRVRSLLENAALVLTKYNLLYPQHSLPQNLRDMLSAVKICVSCSQSLFVNYRSRLQCVALPGQLTVLPLIQYICPRKHSSQCNFSPCEI